MKVAVSLVKKVISLKQSLYYREENYCGLCGDQLHIETESLSKEDEVIEKVSCAKCSVSVRNKAYKLQ